MTSIVSRVAPRLSPAATPATGATPAAAAAAARSGPSASVAGRRRRHCRYRSPDGDSGALTGGARFRSATALTFRLERHALRIKKGGERRQRRLMAERPRRVQGTAHPAG